MMFNALNCNRPILIYGAGIHLSGAKQEAIDFAHQMGIPVCPTWGGLDILPSDDPLSVGSFGTHGTRAGNFAVQNADLIISIGSRLDSKATGTPIESFARDARISMVDIDQREIDKFKGRVKGVCEDAKEFFLHANMINMPPFDEWRNRITEWKKKYPVVSPEYHHENGVNPYVFIEALSEQVPEGTIVCTDTGCAVAWVSQAWKWKKGQRFIHAFNQTPMGYGLPAAIGAYYAGAKSIILITGDGSLMMNIGELATVSSKKIPVKMFMFNNQGHAMCRQTEREWMDGKYYSTGLADLSFPQFRQWAMKGENFMPTWVLETPDWRKEKVDSSMAQIIESALYNNGPSFVEIKIDPDCDVVPKVKYGFPNEDGHPLLPRDEFNQQMIVKQWTAN